MFHLAMCYCNDVAAVFKICAQCFFPPHQLSDISANISCLLANLSEFAHFNLEPEIKHSRFLEGLKEKALYTYIYASGSQPEFINLHCPKKISNYIISLSFEH
jgi:hypothetical protein